MSISRIEHENGLATSAPKVVDTDVHHHLADWSEIAEFVPSGLRHRVSRKGGPPMAGHGFAKLGPPFGDVPMPTGTATQGFHPASDPHWVKEKYLDPNGVSVAILTGNLLSLGVQPGADIAAAVAKGANDWLLEKWIRPFSCFKGSILISQQDPAQAVAEIDRLGEDPGMVQVLMSSASEAPLGRRTFHPIYETCVRHKLPLALHFGGEGAGSSPPATAVGHPSTYFEWYASLPQTYMAHIVSMVTDGVFTKFPSLKVVLNEAGVFWLPHVMWRFDKNWKAQRSESPWVEAPPSRYILEHFYLTTYPLEASPEASYLHQVLEMIDGERTLLFSSNYPNWEYGDPFDMIDNLPDTMRSRVLAENALDLYGERLIVPNR